MAIAEVVRKPEMSKAEWDTRVNLAMLYRVIAKLRMTDLIFTHLSARIPGEEDTFLINNYGEMFEEVTASSLTKIDMDGNVIGEGDFNFAGFCIHSGVYRARPDVMCVTHLHTKACVAVSALECGLLPISQHSLAPLMTMAYHDYEGPANDLAERESLGRNLGDKFCMMLRNHGSLCAGRTIPECFHFTYYFETACQIQIDAMSAGAVKEIPDAVIANSFKQYQSGFDSGEMGVRVWESLRRQLERDGADYAV